MSETVGSPISSEKIIETQPLPELEQIPPRPVTEEEGHTEEDFEDYFSEEFREKFKLDWEDHHDPRVVELVQFGEVRSYFPGYSFDLRLKFCHTCIKHLLTHLNVVKQHDGMFLLKYYMCQKCLEHNKIKLLK